MKPQVTGAKKHNPRRDPDLTRKEILEAAITEFANHGVRGARIDDIALGTNTSKRMLYYYFGSKAELYEEVVRENYRRIRSMEKGLNLGGLQPAEALRVLTRATMDHYEADPDMACIVALENLTGQGETARAIDGLPELNQTAIEVMEGILAAGRASGVFRSDPGAPNALDVHEVLSALVLNRVTQRHTFLAAFGRDMLEGGEVPHVRSLIEDTVLRLVLADPTAG